MIQFDILVKVLAKARYFKRGFEITLKINTKMAELEKTYTKLSMSGSEPTTFAVEYKYHIQCGMQAFKETFFK